MATTHYSFPTINGTDTIDGVNAINGLANAVDTALYKVEQEGSGTPGANSITSAMIQNGAVTTEKIQNGAVTGEKIQNGAVTSDKLDSAVQSQIQQGVNANTNFSATPSSASGLPSGAKAHRWGPLVVVHYSGFQTLNNGGNALGTMPSNMHPSSQCSAACSVNGGNGACYLYATASGSLGIWNMGSTLDNVECQGTLTFFAGV